MTRLALIGAVGLAATFAAGGARALECRAVSGESFITGSSNYSVGVKGCAAPAAANAAPRAGAAPSRGLSPLLQLYERPGASLDVSIHAPKPTHPSAQREPSRGVPTATVDLPPAPARSPPPQPRIVRQAPRAHVVVAGTWGGANAHVYDAAVSGVARMYDIDPAFMGALVRQESGFHAAAVSPKGARGLMQVMPGTARRFGVDGRALQDPVVNLAVGAVYLKSLQRRYGNNLPLVLAAYNAGEGAVARHGRRVPPYRETRTYVSSILTQYRDGLYAGRAAAAR